MAKKIKAALPVSKTGYSCPECGKMCDSKSLVSHTESKFDSGIETNTEPCYKWDETHKCGSCKTLYLLHNGT